VRHSSDEEDEEDEDYSKPKKRIPDWANPMALSAALRKQQNMDPDDLFGQMESPNLEGTHNTTLTQLRTWT
jgi:hypothetical protein